MNRKTELLSVQSIILGDRLREDFGDINALAESIQTWGLIHPLTVDADNNLIAGERRLRAMKQIGFMEVEVRRWEKLTETERRELELEENLRRKDLTSYEQDKNLVELAKVAKAADKETGSIYRAESAQKPGRPKGAEALGSNRRVAERVGVPETTIRDARKRVAAAETYPVLQQPGWKQYHAMQAADILKRIPEEDRKPVIALIDQPGIPPQAAIPMLQNIAEKQPAERKEIITLSQSNDTRERSLARTKAADKPAMPDDRLPLLRHALDDIKKAIRLHPQEVEAETLNQASDQIAFAIQSIKGKATHAHLESAAN